MEEHSFDSLSKEIADSAISRGRALKLVGAAILGGAFAGLFPGLAEARRRRQGRRKVTVFCGIGPFFFNNCSSTSGKRFTCSPNFGGVGGSATCRSGGTNYRCRVINSIPGGVALSCISRRRRR
jgi:hypothetical protein